MNTLTSLSNVLTMSSLEIAELTGKRHDHVLRDIETLLDELKIGHPKFGGTYSSSQNKQLPCYKLPKRECLILVSGYSITLRTKIIDRWIEIEQDHTKSTSYQQEAPKLLPEQITELKISNAERSLAFFEQLGGVGERDAMLFKDYIRSAILPALDGTPQGRREWPVSDRVEYWKQQGVVNGYKRGDLIAIGRLAACDYRAAHKGEDPTVREQFVDGTTRKVKCYGAKDLSILDLAIFTHFNI